MKIYIDLQWMEICFYVKIFFYSTIQSILILTFNTKINRIFNLHVTYIFSNILFVLFVYFFFFFFVGYNLSIITQFQTSIEI